MRASRLRDEEGSALIAVVGIMVVLTVLAIGAFAMADDNLFQAKHDRGRTQALSVAESGMEQVLWRLKAGQAPTATAFPVKVAEMGTCTIEASQTGPGDWHIVATGEASATPGITRTISANVLTMSLWDMFFSSGSVDPGACGRINANGYFKGSLYMKGDWPTSTGNPDFEGGPFFVKGGDFALSGNAHMGNEGPVDLFCDGNVSTANFNGTVHTVVPDLPPMEQSYGDLQTARNTAIRESIDNYEGVMPADISSWERNDEGRTSAPTTGVPSPLASPFADKTYAYQGSRYYKVVDNNSVVDTSVVAVYLGKGSNGAVEPSFGRPYDPIEGHSPDDFAWDASKGVLTVQGTVFIDAKDLWLQDIKWAGKGTIVCSGNVHTSGTWQPACFTVAPTVSYSPSFNDIAATFDPTDPDGYPIRNCVAISASGAIDMSCEEAFGPMFAGTTWAMDTSGRLKRSHYYGEIIAQDIVIPPHGHVECTTGMSANLPPSLPGGDGPIVVVSGWHEGRN